MRVPSFLSLASPTGWKVPFIIASIITGVAVIPSAMASIYYVAASGDDAASGLSEGAPFATLAKAVATANGDPSAEAVVVLSDLTLDGPVEITGGYLLRGRTTDPRDTTISAAERKKVTPLVKVSAPAAVAHLTLSGGTASGESGGNLCLDGGGVVTNCLLREATGGGQGAGVRSHDGLVTHCVIEDGDVGSCEGVGVYQTGEGAVTEYCVVRGNRMDSFYGKGGGIAARGGIVRYCVISNNITRSEIGHGGPGGGIYSTGATIHHCLVAFNQGGGGGGGIHCEGPGNVVSNCTIVRNTARDGSPALGAPWTAGVEVFDTIIWGNSYTFQKESEAAGKEFAIEKSIKWTNTLSTWPVGTTPVSGDPAFVDPGKGDFRLTACSAAIGTGTGGGDLGYMAFDRTAFSVGLGSLPAKALRAGTWPFTALARNGVGVPRYRWRLDDLDHSSVGTWTDDSECPTNETVLLPGHWRMVVEAKDESGAAARFSRSFYVGATKVYLVPTGTDGNLPSPPYDTLATAANDIREAILYCADGSELVVSDGDYGVTRELYVPARILIRSENGPEKTSIYRIGPYGGGATPRVVHLRGCGATLSGFAVTNGFQRSSYDTRYGSNLLLHEDDVVTNCIIAKSFSRGSAAIASVEGSILDSVVRQNEGGDSFGGAVSLWGDKTLMADCVVSNNLSENGATLGVGICATGGATIRRCIIRGNRNAKSSGGGVYLTESDLYDSVVCDNSAKGAGGVLTRCIHSKRDVVIVNCTIADNRSQDAGGGLQSGANDIVIVSNTLFYGNSSARPSPSPGEPSWTGLDSPRCTVSHIAVPAAGAAVGTAPLVLTNGPAFVDPTAGDYSLSLNSPCRDRGENGGRSPEELDVFRRPRIAEDIIDIGAHEYQPAVDLTCLFAVSGYDTARGKVALEATVDGADLEGLGYRWGTRSAGTEGDFVWTEWNDADTRTLDLAPGRYLFALEVRNGTGEEAASSDGIVYNVVAERVYLVPPEAALGKPVYPFDGWDHAATNITMALSAAGNGTTVTVTNGHFGVTSPAVIAKAVRFESVNGPDVTSIYRAFPCKAPHPAFRPVTMTGPGAFLGGFTVSNGFIGVEPYGGAAILCQDSTVSNCIITGNVMNPEPMGAAVVNIDGHVTRCILRGNTGKGEDGYGVYQTGGKARTDHCAIHDNRGASASGAGAVVIDGGILSECVIARNETAPQSRCSAGVDMKSGLAYNCLVALNKAGSGGGVRLFDGALVNCTIVSNVTVGTRTPRAGGIVFAGNRNDRPGVTNCIIYGNHNPAADGTIGNGTDGARTADTRPNLSHTLLENWESIDPDAVACRSGDPLFVDSDGFDWRLGKKSPCRDAGVTLGFMRGGVDLDGRPRLVHLDRVDLGCYEADYISPGMLLLFR